MKKHRTTVDRFLLTSSYDRAKKKLFFFKVPVSWFRENINEKIKEISLDTVANLYPIVYRHKQKTFSEYCEILEAKGYVIV